MDKAPPIPSVPSPNVPTQVVPASQLLAKRRTGLRFTPDADQRRAIARALDLLDLAELHFEAEAEPQGRDLVVTGRLVAKAVQACVVTLAPVRTRVDQEVRRRFVADWQEPTGEEAEIPDDDTIEPMPAMIDIAGIAIEALALALPEYPRVKGAELGAQEFPAPRTADETETRKPLADLAAMLAKKSSQT